MQGDGEGKLRGASHRRSGQPSPDATMGERTAVILRRTAGMRAAVGVAAPGGGYFLPFCRPIFSPKMTFDGEMYNRTSVLLF